MTYSNCCIAISLAQLNTNEKLHINKKPAFGLDVRKFLMEWMELNGRDGFP